MEGRGQAIVADGSTGGFGSHCCSLGSSHGEARFCMARRGTACRGMVGLLAAGLGNTSTAALHCYQLGDPRCIQAITFMTDLPQNAR